METLNMDKIDVVYGHDGNGPCAIFFRGHAHGDNEEIRSAMLSWAEFHHGIDIDDSEIDKRVLHETWQIVPMEDHDEFDSKFIRDAAGPDSFPVTVLDLREWI